MMKKIGLMLLLGAVFATPAMAGPVGNTGQIVFSGLGPYYPNNGGGEFTAQVSPSGWLDLSSYLPTTGSAVGTSGVGSVANSFQTFCLEENENIGSSGTYDATVNVEAVIGGAGGPKPDPISLGTGWLYSRFASGGWASTTDFNYDTLNNNAALRKTSAAELQMAIWYLEQEKVAADFTGGDPLTNTFLSLVNQAYLANGGLSYAMNDDAGSSFGVYALNLKNGPYATGGNNQDMLYFLKKNSTGGHVPEGGATLVLLGAGLMGIAGFRRKFNV